MKRRNVILDAGTLASILNRKDQHFAWATAQLTDIVPPLLTCESVLSEAHFVLRDVPSSRQAIMELAVNGFYKVAFNVEDEKQAVKRLLEKYAGVPMSFADACLVRQPIPLIYPEK